MKQWRWFFIPKQPNRYRITWGDLVVIIGIGVVIYVGVCLASGAPAVIKGPRISLSPRMLPWYAAFSMGRMTAAYFLSFCFTLIYGYLAAYYRRGEQILLPLLDVLQSVPILSFLPVVLLSLSAVMSQKVAAELASIILIFTSQVWHLTFAWYQSLTTIPKELKEAATTFRFNPWLRFKSLDMPFGAVSLIWNSMMSWSGGWFFLMAAEIFTVGERDFRLTGLGAYLQEAANQGNLKAVALGISTLIMLIVTLDQLIWRPLLAWSDRFKLEMVESDTRLGSWVYEALQSSSFAVWFQDTVLTPLGDRLDAWLVRSFPLTGHSTQPANHRIYRWLWFLFEAMIGLGLLYGFYRAGQMLLTLPLSQWMKIGTGLLATLLRVATALIIALAWTVPVGVIIGTNHRLAAWLQPMIQVIASVPATALFPVILLAILGWPGGLNLAAVLLMLMGTQWYILFNVIAGAMLIPQDLKYTTALLQLSKWGQWRILILPSLLPYLVTGAITASGGAWNASIVAEYVVFGGRTMTTVGIGALINQATVNGNYPMLLAATLSMVLAVVIINRVVWRYLYRLAEGKYRME